MLSIMASGSDERFEAFDPDFLDPLLVPCADLQYRCVVGLFWSDCNFSIAKKNNAHKAVVYKRLQFQSLTLVLLTLVWM